MKNLKIGTKLLLTFMIIIALFCGTVYVATSGLRQSSDKYSEFYHEEYQITQRVMSMRRGLQIIVKDLTFLTIDDDAARCESYQSDMQKEMELLEENATWISGNLDSNSSKAVIQAFTQAKTNLGATIFMVTHDTFSASYCDRVIILKDGKIVKHLTNHKDRRDFHDTLLDVLKKFDGGECI